MGDYVVLEPEEVAAAVPENLKTLSVSTFIGCNDIDDVYFDEPYYLAPSGKAAEEGFSLIREGMRKKKVAAIASAVLFRRAIIGMAAMVGGGTGAAMTAVTMIFEITRRSSRRDKMKSTGYARFAVAALAGASYFLGIGLAHAKTGLSAHDGIYALHIVTQHGSCHKSYTTKIAVRGGQIHATGHALMRGSGHIDATNRVVVTLRFLHHAVHVSGRMRDHSGSGKWSSHGLGCAGSWHATRQS